MKKILYIIMISVFILVGCSETSGSKDFVDYEKEKVVNSLNDLSFDPEIPKLLPFEPTETEIDMRGIGGVENSFIIVTFMSENQGEITFQAGLGINAIDFTEEKVTISENLKGKYGVNDTTKILKWDKNDIYYELLVDSDSISRNEVLEIAKSLYKVN
ncbi:DUF4367 domain-containing protein [Filobacillus milosensis]|uniref:DUF4367 domain-containing protein n=1 Tax=Filobacillus milosensis TaxID=94137 RepID=A0A4Y8IE01_9BACI|nr:DUF4367 domain-containing protein [Filobacillus milosensis]TFB13029.1 DUF4367 domain-containing protein [Filobacillus milosensis]